MAFPSKLLHDGEKVVVDVRAHWTGFARAAVVLAAALVGLSALAGADAPELLQLLAAVATLVALGRFVLAYARWASTTLAVTDERLVHRHGVLSKEIVEIPLDRVSAVACRRSVLGRLLRYGDLVVDSGGDDRHRRQRFGPIPRPEAVLHALSRLLRPATLAPEERPSRRSSGASNEEVWEG